MSSTKLKANTQDILLNTIHNLENVTEVYFNGIRNIVTEIMYLSNSKVYVYQYELDSYLKKIGSYSRFKQTIENINNI